MTTPKIGPSDKAGLSDLPSSAQRTPGPWVARIWASEPQTVGGKHFDGVRMLMNDGAMPIMSESGRICLVDPFVKFKRGEGHKSECAERDANAAFIVTACNAHDELVAALRNLHSHVNGMRRAGQCFPTELIDAASAALAKLS